jgi:hypothetical protein
MQRTTSLRRSMLELLSLLIYGLPLLAQVDSPKMTFHHAVKSDVSPPLRELAKLPTSPPYNFHILDRPGTISLPVRQSSSVVDPVEQRSTGAPVSATVGVNVQGVLDVDQTYPPDQNLAVGDTQVVIWVNSSYAVFDKSTGALIAGPFEGNSLWAGFGQACGTDPSPTRDIIVQWDKIHHRWLFSYDIGSGPPYPACIAISQTADATGSYYRYQYSLAPGIQLPDYQKWGIWTNAYYQTQINIHGLLITGSYPCAYNSAKLLVGDPSAEQICFQLSSNDFGLLPADIDSSTPPPPNEDEFFIGGDLSLGNDALYLYSMHPDFANPSQSTITGNNLSQPITVAAFNPACNGQRFLGCVPELNGEMLYALGDRLMYRFAYFNDAPAGHVGPTVGPLPRQHWFVSHAVQASGGQVGMRWYELVAPQHTVTPSALTVYQQGTYAPDLNYRWMGSVARDKAGNILLGYSLSSATMYPAVAFTGRVPTDPLGTMEGEQVIYQGTGAQVNSYNSWGDYSAVQLDSADGCTFWYVNEYYITTGTYNFDTRLASIKFNNCH